MANKGEWSELYALLSLLLSGYLVSADKNGNSIPDKKAKIRMMRRGDVVFCLNSNNSISVLKDSQNLGSFDSSIINNYLPKMLSTIKSEKKPETIGSFEDLKRDILKTLTVSELNRDEIFKIKASSQNKSDVDIILDNPRVDPNSYLGFSIKSYIGSNPTLFNASHSTKIKYWVKNWDDSDYHNIEDNKLNYRSIKEYIIKKKKELFFDSMVDESFYNNLRLVDDIMPNLISYMEYYFYIKKGSSIKEITEALNKSDPLHASNIPGYYEKKVKDFLAAVALGMKPKSIDWEGKEEASGGFIIVKSDGTIVCYPLYDRDNFREYLFEHTRFDTPATKKNLNKNETINQKDGTIHRENGKDLLTLNLQIRFFGEDSTKKKRRKPNIS